MVCDNVSEICELKYLKAAPDVVLLKAHMFYMLYTAQCTNDTHSKLLQSFLEKYASVEQSTIYRVLIKTILMKLFLKLI